MSTMLLDMNNLWWRTSCAIQGLDWGAEYGFIKTLLSLGKSYPDTQIWLVGDRGICTWRRVIYNEYKGSRGETVEQTAHKDELYKRLNAFTEVISYVLPYYYCEGAEADD